MRTKIVFIESINSNVTIISKPNIKNIRLSVDINKGISVSKPLLIPTKSVIKLIEQKKDWILKKIKQQKELNVIKTITSGYKTKKNTINIEFSLHNNNVEARQEKNVIFVKFSIAYKIADKPVQEYLKKIIIQVLKQEAQDFVIPLTKQLAQKHNLNLKNIKIGSAKTRWGSCSGENNLIFSCFIMQLEDELIKYIILHELAHFTHKNHSKQFYQLLDYYCNGNHKELNKKLKLNIINLV